MGLVRITPETQRFWDQYERGGVGAVSDTETESVRGRLLERSLKPEEIDGVPSVREARAAELVRWFARYTRGQANPKWLESHACELAYYVATLKGMP